MSFLTRELSRLRGQPVNLYYFRYGEAASSFHAYTDAARPIAAPGVTTDETVTYLPRPISRGNITASGSLDKSALDLRAPRDIDLAELFLVYPPSYVVRAVIRQGHLGESDFPLIWSGRVVAAGFEGSTCVFTLEPGSTSMRRNGLRRRYQYGCPHALYRDRCRADKAAATVAVTVVGTGATTIALPAAWFGARPVDKYLRGFAEWTTPEGNREVRTILQIVAGKDLLLNGLVRGLVAGGTVEVSLGCNHQQDDCLSLHVEAGSTDSPPAPNIHNHGGQDWTPQNNPVGFDNQFY